MTSLHFSRNRRHRRGMTLVELAVVIAAASIIMSTVAVSLHRMYRADRSVRDELAESASLMRLSSMFRADAHLAIDAAKSDAAEDGPEVEGLLMRLSGNETIAYTFTNSSIRRTKRRGEEVIHRDAFRLASDVDVELVFRDEQAAQMASIIVTRRSDTAASARPLYRIDAAVGLDHSKLTEEE